MAPEHPLSHLAGTPMPPPATPPLTVTGRQSPVADEPLVIDCDRCTVRGIGCPDCMVTILLGGPPEDIALDEEDQRALSVLSDAGLIPPLRMVGVVDSPQIDPA
ncbi:MAG: hypothetical protein ACRDPG_10205 [Nocardioidaceae bacterium]